MWYACGMKQRAEWRHLEHAQGSSVNGVQHASIWDLCIMHTQSTML